VELPFLENAGYIWLLKPKGGELLRASEYSEGELGKDIEKLKEITNDYTKTVGYKLFGENWREVIKKKDDIVEMKETIDKLVSDNFITRDGKLTEVGIEELLGGRNNNLCNNLVKMMRLHIFDMNNIFSFDFDNIDKEIKSFIIRGENTLDLISSTLSLCKDIFYTRSFDRKFHIEQVEDSISGMISSIDYLYRNFDKFHDRLYEKFSEKFSLIDYYLNESKDNSEISHPLSYLLYVLFSITGGFSEGNIFKVSKILYDLGYIGMYDDEGLGIIHEMEPEQAFFISSKFVEYVQLFRNEFAQKRETEDRSFTERWVGDIGEDFKRELDKFREMNFEEKREFLKKLKGGGTLDEKVLALDIISKSYGSIFLEDEDIDWLANIKYNNSLSDEQIKKIVKSILLGREDIFKYLIKVDIDKLDINLKSKQKLKSLLLSATEKHAEDFLNNDEKLKINLFKNKRYGYNYLINILNNYDSKYLKVLWIGENLKSFIIKNKDYVGKIMTPELFIKLKKVMAPIYIFEDYALNHLNEIIDYIRLNKIIYFKFIGTDFYNFIKSHKDLISEENIEYLKKLR
jgi:hypothetical protein